MLRVILLGFILVMVGIELDIFLPTLSVMQRDLRATETEITWVITANLIGLALSTFFYGGVADSMGRRPTILFGLFLFFLGSLGCYFATDLISFLGARFIQGVGCGAPITICFTIILDTFEEKKAASTIGLFNGVITGATTLAPIIGVLLQEYFSWRANFALLAIGGGIALFLSWLGLDESLPNDRKKEWHFKKSLKTYLFILGLKKTWHLGMIPILMYSALLVYLVNFPLIVAYNSVNIKLVGYLQAAIMFSFVLGSLIVSFLISRLQHDFISRMAYILACGGGILFLLGSYIFPQSWIILTLFVCLISAGTAFIISLYMGKSLDVFPESRGLATAVQGTLRLATSSLLVMLSGLAFNENFFHVAIIICACIFGSFYLYSRKCLEGDDKLGIT